MSELQVSGPLLKMETRLNGKHPEYSLPVGDGRVSLNDKLGTAIRLHFTGTIGCIYCGRKTSKSFNQGYCFPCFQKLARCDSCIVSPEKCHFFQGTCREPEWGERNCMTDHIVYLANSSGIKVGITRASQVPTRWVDQGAVQAMPLFRVDNRLQSGVVETVFKQHVADKTSWQAMLKGEPEAVDLAARGEQLVAECEPELALLRERFGSDCLQRLQGAAVTDIDYPVLRYPEKIKSLNFDKQATVEGTLLGIKGQYLIFDTGVINIRKFGGYHIEFYPEV